VDQIPLIKINSVRDVHLSYADLIR